MVGSFLTGIALSACVTITRISHMRMPLLIVTSVDSRKTHAVGPLRSRRSEALSWAKPIPSAPAVPIRQHGMRGDGCYPKWNNIDQAAIREFNDHRKAHWSSAALVSAIVAPRSPIGSSGPIVVSREVCRSTSALTKAPISTAYAET